MGALSPKKIFSVFDYIQDAQGEAVQSVDYTDLNWPKNVLFEFTPFHLIVRDDGKLIANVFFDFENKINRIDYFKNNQHYESLIFDDRGFISQIQKFNDQNQHIQSYYLDPRGNWHIKYDPQDDSVEVNPQYQWQFVNSHYNHINDLISEIVQKHFLSHLHTHDRMVITVDDQSTVDPKIFADYSSVYECSKWYPFTNSISNLRNIKNIKVVCDTQFTAKKVQKLLQLSSMPPQIPLYHAMFKLGHSQRLSQQQIFLYVDDISLEQLISVGEIIVDFMLNNPHEFQFFLLSTGNDQGKTHAFIQTMLKRHQGQFTIKDQALEEQQQSQGENFALMRTYRKYMHDKESVIPELFIQGISYNNSFDILKGLDKARILIDWGDHPDDYLQMVTVSIGIPALQRVETNEVANNQNGIICKDLIDLRNGLHYYLDQLKHWNESLVNDVKIMDKQSASRLLAKWDELWKRGEING